MKDLTPRRCTIRVQLLLVRLRDLAGLKFREIAELPVFADLQYLSLAHIYKNRKRMAANEYTD